MSSSPEPSPPSTALAPLRLAGVAVGLAMLSVPLLHLYLRVDLTASQLLVHTLDVGLATALICAGHSMLGALGSRLGRRLEWRDQRAIPMATGALALVLAYLFWPVGLLPGASAIEAQHRSAGHGDMGLRIVPLAALVAFLAWRAVERRTLRRQLDAMRGALARQDRVMAPGAMEPVIEAKAAGEPLSLLLHHERGVLIVAAHEVLRVQAMENYCELWLDPGGGEARPRRVLVRTTLSEIRARLPEPLFVQTHRSHLIRIDRVRALVRDGRSAWLDLDAAGRVPIARSRLGEVQAHVERIAT